MPRLRISILSRHEREVQDQLTEAMLRAHGAQFLDELE